ncbi:MAG: hypothetical protein DRJ35_05175 [Thermoprotei archaeon]|nr:MAG: hypothetical protein DRJ35_05175 [Thermoprotei archaeon]
MPFFYLTIIAVVLSVIYAIIDMFSIDRVLKLVRETKAFVFIENEVHFGKLHIPPRSGGGFEVVYTEEGIENPQTMIAFLIENYHETRNKKFWEKAVYLTDYFKKKGILPKDFDINKVKISAWNPPSLVSRKIYSSEVGKIWMIISFIDLLSEKEKKARWKRLSSIYSPSILKKLYRKVQNSLGYVKDKITASLTAQSATLLKVAPTDLQKTLQDAQTKIATSFITTTYDALLENSIGRLVTVKFKDIDGEEKFYQGVLGEYSDKYIYILDVDYRLQLEAKIKGDQIINIYPTVKFYGFRPKIPETLKIERKDGKFTIINISSKPVRIEKLISSGKEINIFKVLWPQEKIQLTDEFQEEATLQFEISLESDVVWPRSKATIIGLGDYPPSLLKRVLEDFELIEKVKKIT